MSNISIFKNANLPSVVDLSKALKANLGEVTKAGSAIIKMDKTGHWVFGADQTEVQDNSQWAVNPFSFIHGYIAWGNAEVLGEKMVSITEPLPELEPAPANAKRGWETQVGLEITCINGEDKDLVARFCTTSVGGKRAVQELAVQIAAQVDKDQSKPVPIVELLSEHYSHKSYGRVFTPVFKVVRWESLEVESANEAPALEEPSLAQEDFALEPAPAAAPARRRRAAV